MYKILFELEFKMKFLVVFATLCLVCTYVGKYSTFHKDAIQKFLKLNGIVLRERGLSLEPRKVSAQKQCSQFKQNFALKYVKYIVLKSK